MRNRTAASVATFSGKRGSEGKAAHSETTLVCVCYILGVVCASLYRVLPVDEGKVGECAARDDPACRMGASPENEASSKAVSEIAFTGVLRGARKYRK
jgi:hypothetical protein